MVEQYGPLVRLWGVRRSQLPNPDASSRELLPLLKSILLEALPFISDVPSSTTIKTSSWREKGTKKFPNTESPVQLYERKVTDEDLEYLARKYKLSSARSDTPEPETWALRRSVHRDAAVAGTAEWDEFVRYFKEGHAEAEKEYTPSVLSTRVIQEWDCSGVEVPFDGDVWTDWTLKLEESVHKLPKPLQKRLFPVFQATCSVRGRREFLVIQIAAKEPDVGVKGQRGRVRGAYTSIERLRETAEGTEWVMGTVSDARGALPPWMQRLAVPGQIAKDVEFFLKWIANQRRGGA
ncbi:hypothetical protein S7711_00851 [Stachybotrys chartarum IBT 7711]|uniref:DUF3074 domain-containing protein n=1 Tax=Stachybotrys chartarum (strain CBS 109288 / IBT 7711) TaxID=1280523 RepID=A0A084B0E8_STACB|nr:hypothetical protein S7711_00851 [Stachybotrys chartarum IBT 7711]KFA46997.1 hypothetical protein S40293_08984 [Stachybotrys chartarum IBT 40293]KFA78129.1 hypothetical protein S40288_01405 [Stachybotrys chartarum IBT 40288]